MKYYAIKVKYCNGNHDVLGTTYYKYQKDINELYRRIENDHKYYEGSCCACKLEVRAEE